MEHQLHATHTGNHHAHGAHDDFLVRFRQNLWKEIKSVLYWFFFVVYSILFSLLYGFLMWLFEFDDAKAVAAVIVPPLVVYFVGQYLTLIPTFFVLVLMMLPLRRSGGILAIAMVASFFAVFLI